MIKQYTNRKNIIESKNGIIQYEYPWFIKIYNGRPIITLNDLTILLGVKINLSDLIKDKMIIAYIDWNGIGRGASRKEFEESNLVKYEDETLIYLYISGLFKILKMFMDENKMKFYELENIIRLLESDNSKIKYI